MTLETFKKLIDNSNLFWGQIEKLSDIGIDIYYSVFPDIFSVFEKEIWVELYGDDGWSIIEWFIYEKQSHANPDEIKMYDANNTEICKDITSLYHYLEKNYRK